MIEQSGQKLRIFAVIQMVFAILATLLVLFAGIGSGLGFTAIIYAAVLVFSALVSFFSLCALADAAEYAKMAAFYAEKVAYELSDEGKKAKEQKEKQSAPGAMPMAFNPDGKVPAWQRVEMEKAEAEQKPTEE